MTNRLEPLYGDYHNREEPITWIRQYELTFQDSWTDTYKINRFSLHLAAGSFADTWYMYLDPAKKASWTVFLAEYEARWPCLVPAAPPHKPLFDVITPASPHLLHDGPTTYNCAEHTDASEDSNPVHSPQLAHATTPVLATILIHSTPKPPLPSSSLQHDTTTAIHANAANASDEELAEEVARARRKNVEGGEVRASDEDSSLSPPPTIFLQHDDATSPVTPATIPSPHVPSPNATTTNTPNDTIPIRKYVANANDCKMEEETGEQRRASRDGTETRRSGEMGENERRTGAKEEEKEDDEDDKALKLALPLSTLPHTTSLLPLTTTHSRTTNVKMDEDEAISQQPASTTSSPRPSTTPPPSTSPSPQPLPTTSPSRIINTTTYEPAKNVSEDHDEAPTPTYSTVPRNNAAAAAYAHVAMASATTMTEGMIRQMEVEEEKERARGNEAKTLVLTPPAAIPSHHHFHPPPPTPPPSHESRMRINATKRRYWRVRQKEGWGGRYSKGEQRMGNG